MWRTARNCLPISAASDGERPRRADARASGFRGRFGMSIPPDRHPASVGDLIVGPAVIGGWAVLAVAGVDEDGFVVLVEDEEGRRIGIGRAYETSSLETPHFIIPAEKLSADGRLAVVGFHVEDLDDVRAEMRRWVAA